MSCCWNLEEEKWGWNLEIFMEETLDDGTNKIMTNTDKFAESSCGGHDHVLEPGRRSGACLERRATMQFAWLLAMSCCCCMIMGWNLEEVGHAGRRAMMWFCVAASNLPIPRRRRRGCNFSVPPSPPLPPPMTPPLPPPRHATATTMATVTSRCKGASFRAASVVGLR